MGNYFAIVTCRNSEKSITDSLNSLKNQTLQAEYVIVINDGSTDRTAEILSEIQKDWNSLYVINHPDWGYDIKRVVKNWNEAIKLTHDKALQMTPQVLIFSLDLSFKIRRIILWDICFLPRGEFFRSLIEKNLTRLYSK